MAILDAFNQYQINNLGSMMSPVKSVGGKAVTGAGAGIVASGVISGLTDIATGFINAGRRKNTYQFNKSMLELQGRMQRLSADVQIKNIREKALGLFGTQRAAYAKAGLAMSGSPAAVMMDSLREAELDEIYTDISATYNIGSLNIQGGIYDMYGKSGQADAVTNTFKSILSMANNRIERG